MILSVSLAGCSEKKKTSKRSVKKYSTSIKKRKVAKKKTVNQKRYAKFYQGLNKKNKKKKLKKN